MIGDTIAFTYNAVAKTLVKVNQDSFTAEYYLDDTANLMRFSLFVKHTIPATGKIGESHLVRLDTSYYDVAGLLLRTASSWTVMSTNSGFQDLVSSQRTQAALLTITVPATTDKVLKRES